MLRYIQLKRILTSSVNIKGPMMRMMIHAMKKLCRVDRQDTKHTTINQSTQNPEGNEQYKLIPRPITNSSIHYKRFLIPLSPFQTSTLPFHRHLESTFFSLDCRTFTHRNELFRSSSSLSDSSTASACPYTFVCSRIMGYRQ